MSDAMLPPAEPELPEDPMLPPEEPEVSPVTPIATEAPAVDPARVANVKRILKNIERAKRHWEPDFKRMRSDMDFASGLQRPGQAGYDPTEYTLNLVLRHIRLRTASLYAKNPKAVYRRKPKMDFVIWDESPATLQMAQQAQMQGMMQAQAEMMGHNGGPPMDPMADPAMPPAPPPPPIPPEALMLAEQMLADVQQGMQRRADAKRVGRTLELLWDWFVKEPIPNVKIQMKRWVRRTLTCGTGYVKLGFQRSTGHRPDQATRLADLKQDLAVIERLRARLRADNADATDFDAEAEQLRLALERLQSQPEVILREGPILDFPRSTALLPDPATVDMKGWIGTGWVAEEFKLPRSRVEELYKIRLPGLRGGTVDGALHVAEDSDDPAVCFWQYYEKDTGLLITVAEGWDDYLEEPREPEVVLERFFPYYALTFNDIEHEKRIFPPSDVELMRSPQDEYNRQRESLRQHRIANRPLYVTAAGAFDKKDTANLSEYGAHDVVTLNQLKEGQPVTDLLQPVPKVPIDPNVYETDSLFSDIQRATGTQEANIGGTSGSTATETSVAESSRMSATGSDVDELDEVLTELARDFGQVCQMNMTEETVKRLVGPGALWPQLSKADIQAEGQLEVEAGSSGRPNRERDLANFERAMPYLLQIPGIDPEALAKYGLRMLDDKIELGDFVKAGLPSITAMNRGPGPQGAGGDPMQQGPAGAGNAPATQQTPGGAQPAYGPSGNPTA